MSSDDLSREELLRRLETRTSELRAAQERIAALTGKTKELEASKKKLQQIRQSLKDEVNALRESAEFRFGKAIVRPFKKLFGASKPKSQSPASQPASAKALDPIKDYDEWRKTRLPSAAELDSMRVAGRAFKIQPLISVIMPTFNTDAGMLDAAIESVRAQVYENWELVIADDASTAPHIASQLRAWQEKDVRIRVTFLAQNCGIALATNAAVAEAKGEWIALLDHDDWLEPEALFESVRAMQEAPEADFIYSDEDKVDETGRFLKPFFKPDWSPNALFSCNYICHFTVMRRALFEQIGGYRTGFDGAQDYDLFLRATEQARQILHVPKPLYHWRISASSTSSNSEQKPAAIEHGRLALEDAVKRRGLAAAVETTRGARYRVRYKIPDPKKITILIPTKDRLELLARCIESIEQRTSYPNYEIVILNNGSEQPETLAYFARTKHRVLNYDGPFNFAAICNYGVRATDGEWLLFLNNDIEVIEAGWLTAMAEHVQRPEVGAVGAKLLFPDDTIQHGGVVFSESDLAVHAFHSAKRNSYENGGLLQIVRNCSAVTAACLLMRREVFEKIGGFDEVQFAVSYNDTDLCLRVRELGLQIIYTPFAELYHYESQSRGYDKPNPTESHQMRTRWASVLAHDPFHNPNLVRAKKATR